MKTFLSLIVTLFILFNLNAQSNDNSIVKKVFNKVVLDFGAAPGYISTEKANQMSSYNFALGYQICKKLDIRLNLDYFNYNHKEIEEFYWNYREKLYGLSMGLNYKAFNCKETTFLKNTSLGFVGKSGIAVTSSGSEHVAFFYDLSTRIYFGKIPYIGFGYNYLFDYFLKPNLSSFYFTFGIDF